MLNWYKKSKIIVTAETAEMDEEVEEVTRSDWVSVDSSCITDVAYHDLSEIFEIRFKNGREYTYMGLPKGVYEEFMASDSKGRFYNSVIKPVYRLIRE
jgi:hypothetical protein